MHLVSRELFGRRLTVADFPKLKSIRALGMSDKPCYANLLAEKFDYTNTSFPPFDITATHREQYGTYDLILAADVLEHVAPPLDRALDEIFQLLKPSGFLAATVPVTRDDAMREHFPELHEYKVVQLGGKEVLVNRRRDGTLEAREDLVFHEGPGMVLEMRQLGRTGLRAKLLAAGFRAVDYLVEDVKVSGILFDCDVSQPLIARKERFCIDPGELLDALAKLRMASESRWVRLGRKLGVGPKLAG
jgi:SAM-dependent methyltransferase